VEPVIATPQSHHVVPNLPVLEAEITVFLSIIRIHSLSNNVCIGQPVVVIAVWDRRILIGEVDVRLHTGIVVRKTQCNPARS
jgi:hypothetical protein